MEKPRIESSTKTTKTKIKPTETQQFPSTLETDSSKRPKPRAIVFKANDKELNKIKEIIETQFPQVEIIYITTGPAASTLRVTKSMPAEPQNPSEELLYTIG